MLTDLTDTPFFPGLQRRAKYRLTRAGNYYRDYQQYRQEIREDCLGRCVYCDSHENELGGQEFMDLDHFRPKVYEEFKHLANDPHNLVWSCKVCNRKKWSHWPALGIGNSVIDKEGFIDPFEEDRREYFAVRQDGEMVALKPPASYIISLLVLNRPTQKQRRELRLQAYELVPKLEAEIRKLEQRHNLLDKEKEKLALLRAAKYNIEDRLDFSLQ